MIWKKLAEFGRTQAVVFDHDPDCQLIDKAEEAVEQAYVDGFTAGVAFDVLPPERRVRAYAAEYARPTKRP